MIKIEKKGKLFFSNEKKAKELSQKSFFGNIVDNYVVYQPYEVLYLMKEKKAILLEKNKKISMRKLMKEIKEKDFLEYLIYENLRKRGYILKSGVKFGGNFIVYDKGKKPGIHHSDWILIMVKRNQKIDIKELSSKIRVATSTNKKILMAVVEDNKIMYYEIKWKKM